MKNPRAKRINKMLKIMGKTWNGYPRKIMKKLLTKGSNCHTLALQGDYRINGKKSDNNIPVKRKTKTVDEKGSGSQEM